jgi:hypothetical protein
MDLEGDRSPWETRAMDRWQRRFLATDSSAEQGLEVGRSLWRAVDCRTRQRVKRKAAIHSRANDGENLSGLGRGATHPIPQAPFGDVGVRASGSEPHRGLGRRSFGSGFSSEMPRVALAWEVGWWLATLSTAARPMPTPACRRRAPTAWTPRHQLAGGIAGLPAREPSHRVRGPLRRTPPPGPDVPAASAAPGQRPAVTLVAEASANATSESASADPER